MIDIRRLRSSFDDVRANLARRNIDLADLDQAARLDEDVRSLSSERDELRSRVKVISKSVGDAHRKGDKVEAERLAAESRNLGEREKELDEKATRLSSELRDLLLGIPNEIAAAVPDGASEDDNPVVKEAVPREWAEHNRKPHWEIGAELGILDPEHAVKLSGSMFQMYRGAGATLVRALCQYALDLNADVWEEVKPPTLVRSETMVATGHLPKFGDEAYAVERDDLWTIPTAEVSLTSMARDEVLDEAALPMRMMACTPCFRREAGSAGKDTRGLLRMHEFEKVELMAYVMPEQAEGVMFEILERAERAFTALGLQYRVIEICSGDLGQSHHRSFDVEAYAPGVDAWLEISSCSWYSDYQARRANVRFRPTDGSANQIVHTCNGSALPVPRVLAALLETHRQEDGSVLIPEVLHPYMRGMTVLQPK
jgi:seryl-tRNA synthetase